MYVDPSNPDLSTAFQVKTMRFHEHYTKRHIKNIKKKTDDDALSQTIICYLCAVRRHILIRDRRFSQLSLYNS